MQNKLSRMSLLGLRCKKEANDAAEKLGMEFAQDVENLLLREGAAKATSTNHVNSGKPPVNSGSSLFSTGSPSLNTASPSGTFRVGKPFL